MRMLMQISIAAVCLAAFGCGGSNESTREPSAGSPAAAAPRLITEDALTACAGFSAAKAAGIFGVPPDALTDYSRTQGALRMCSYRKPDDPRVSVAFTLGRRESVAAAVESLKSERESMGSAQSAIDRVTGTASTTAASEDVSGIGDEAFYSAMNGAIMMRVGNVLVQVMSPADMTLKKRVAEEIVKGLRQ